MNGVFLLSLMAAAGVVVAAVAVALPAARAADDGVPRWEQLASPRTSLRSRLNQPFQALAERSNRQHRLTAGSLWRSSWRGRILSSARRSL